MSIGLTDVVARLHTTAAFGVLPGPDGPTQGRRRPVVAHDVIHIEGFYSSKRQHSANNNLSPAEFEAEYAREAANTLA